MHNPTTQGIVIFFVGITFLLLLFISFIVTIVYKYQQKQNNYFKEIEALKISHENALLLSQLEIQEQTIQNISREIHDNIGQKLTLAKFHLNTLNLSDLKKTISQVGDTAQIIGETIKDLSDISHSMSSEIILNNGLIKALEFESIQLKKLGIYKVNYKVTGNSIFLNANTDLVLFRIVQEVINNIVKHSKASIIDIHLHYNLVSLTLEIKDNGVGFQMDENKYGIGLQNIKKRALILKGKLDICSSSQTGTLIKIEIPIDENK